MSDAYSENEAMCAEEDDQYNMCGFCGSIVYPGNRCSCATSKKEQQRIKDSGIRQHFDSGAVRDTQTGKGRMDLLPWRAIMRLAKHFEDGAIKYEARNWEKGIPLSRFADSGARHFAKFMCGQQDEPHLVAACWNLMCLLDTQLRVEEGLLPPELNDIPNGKPDPRQFLNFEGAGWSE